jgi:hypothetical protein
MPTTVKMICSDNVYLFYIVEVLLRLHLQPCCRMYAENKCWYCLSLLSWWCVVSPKMFQTLGILVWYWRKNLSDLDCLISDIGMTCRHLSLFQRRTDPICSNATSHIILCFHAHLAWTSYENGPRHGQLYTETEMDMSIHRIGCRISDTGKKFDLILSQISEIPISG